MLEGAIIVAALAVSVVGALFAVCHRDQGTRDRRWLLIFALAVHGLVGAVVWAVLASSADGYLFAEGQYFAGAAHVAATGVPQRFHSYLTAVGLIFEVTGTSIVVGRALGIWAASVAAVAAYELVRQVGGRQSALWTGAAVALWPSLILWSIVLGRDALVVLVLVVIALGLVWAVRGRWWGVVIVTAAAVVLVTLRPWAYALAAVALVCALAIHAFQGGRRALPMCLALLAAVGLAGVVGDAGFLGVRYVAKESTTERLVRVHEQETQGATGVSRPPPNSFADVVAGFPAGVLHLVLGPLPWEPGPTSAKAMMALELPLWYLVLGLALVAAVRARGARVSAPWIFLGLFAVLVLAVIAAVEGNAATALRHRAMALPYVIAVAASLARRPSAQPIESRALGG